MWSLLSSSSSSIVLWLALAAWQAHAGVQELALNDCRVSDPLSLGDAEDLLNFTTAYVQLDQSQSYAGQYVSDSNQIVLRVVAPGTVGARSEGFSENTGFLSTIVASTEVLNQVSWSNSSALCDSLAGGCPYDPGDIALGLEIPLGSSYAFTELTTRVTVLDTSNPSLQLACFSVTATPYYPDYPPYKIILWAPVALVLAYLVLTWTARLWAAHTISMLNRDAELASSLTSKLSASGIRERHGPVVWDIASGTHLQSSLPLRRFVTPSPREVLWAVQFFALLGMISVDWPHFFYPVVKETAWSTLAYNISLTQDSDFLRSNLADVDLDLPGSLQDAFSNRSSPAYLNQDLPNVLLSVQGANGLERFAYTVGLEPRHLWPNAAAVFCLAALGIIVCSAVAALIALAFSKGSGSPRGVLATRRVSSHGALDDTAAFPGRQEDSGECAQPHGKEDEYSSADFTSATALKASHPSSLEPEPRLVGGVNWGNHARMLCGNLLRLIMLFQLPLIIFSTFHIHLLSQASENVEPASTTTAGLAVVLLVVIICFPFYALWRVHVNSKRNTAGSMQALLAYGTLYNVFGDQSYQFMFVRLAGVTVVGIVIGAVQRSPLAQTITLLVFELVETLTTALFLPYGESAAMGPLAFLFSVIRVITIVLVLLLVPKISIGSPTSGWITYVIMGLHGLVFLILFGILLVKLVEFLVRAVGRAPFDESRSRRATGLNGAIYRSDRSGQGHARRKALVERRTRQKQRDQARTSTFSAGPPATPPHNNFITTAGSAVSQTYTPVPLHEYEDGNIMAAMSGPRFGSNGYVPPGSYSAAPSARSWHDELNTSPSADQQGFTMVRGRRSNPYSPYTPVQNQSPNATSFDRARQSWSSNDYLSHRPPAPDAPIPLQSRPRSYHADIEFTAPAMSPSPSGARMSTSGVSPGPDLLSNSMSASQNAALAQESQSKKPLFGFLPRLGNRKHGDDWSDDSDDEGSSMPNFSSAFQSFKSLASKRFHQGVDEDGSFSPRHSQEVAAKEFKVKRKPQSPGPRPRRASAPPQVDEEQRSSGTPNLPEPENKPQERYDTPKDADDETSYPPVISTSITKPPEHA